MWRAVRVIVICLLALALPLQGAMAGMLSCMAQHAAAAAAASDVHAHAAHAGGAHDHGEAAQAGAGHAHAEPPAPAADADADADAAADTCSLCASCCTGAALPAAMTPLGTPDPGHVHVAALARAVDSVVPDALERPPRTFSD